MFKTTAVLIISLLSSLHFITCNYQDDLIQELFAGIPKALGSSCSEYFQYQRIDQFINGKLELYNIKMGDTVKLTFNRRDFDYYPRFNGSLLPDKSSQAVINRLKNGQLITYRVDFPQVRNLPLLNKIFVNDNELCKTNYYNASEKLLILQHTMEVINGSLPVFTHNINIPNFVEAETTNIELTPLIYGGTKTRRGEYPWLTAIYKRQRNGSTFICGGSLVTSSIIVTAAHCFFGSSLNATKLVVMLGRHDLTNQTEGGFLKRQIQHLILHPEYKYGVGFSDADLALLEMRNHVSFTQYIKPICLWAESADESLIVNNTGVVAGWGDDEGIAISRIPKKVKMHIVSDAECLRSSLAFFGTISTRTLCAGNRDGSGPCEGDSGGGLMINRNGRWMLRGVVSAGLTIQHRCNLLEYTVYCDIARHLNWLKNYITSSAICGISNIELQKQPTFMSVEDICGRSGMESRSEHPWLAAIYRKLTTGLLFVRTGVLISSQYLLTNNGAFTYLDEKKSQDKYRVYLGRYDLNNINENGVVTREISALVFHPDFKYVEKSTFRDNYVVLIQMKTPVSFTEYVKPICLWKQPDDERSEIVVQSATILGWDIRSVFDESVTVPMSTEVNVQRCESWGFNEIMSARLLCVPRLENKNGTILLAKRNGRWLLRGITSLKEGYNTYMSKNFFVYSDISQHLLWIQNYMET